MGKQTVNHRGSGGKKYDSFQPVMNLIFFPPVEDNLVSTELIPVKGVNSVLTKMDIKAGQTITQDDINRELFEGLREMRLEMRDEVKEMKAWIDRSETKTNRQLNWQLAIYTIVMVGILAKVIFT